MKKQSTHTLVLTALFMGIMLLMYAFPFLGFIPLGPINATTMHIPVIIGSLVLGPRVGALLGGFFGILSMLRSTTQITVTSFIFSPIVSGDFRSVIVALIPRILIGVVPYFVYQFLKRFAKTSPSKKSVSLLVAGFLGSMTNTLLVMNLIYFLFMDQYATAIGATSDALYGIILGIILTSGVPEAIVAAIATAAITSVLWKVAAKSR
ncbi:ECF transporter S component [Enterococcus nangangensis]|uniref:ECF transporter S component n=1 Tax=Enterococcus nangangensis TaxID=2559926 RepID=UPI0010F7A50C|nr:ECF transporter S component [Enterococcus nangangensis]